MKLTKKHFEILFKLSRETGIKTPFAIKLGEEVKFDLIDYGLIVPLDLIKDFYFLSEKGYKYLKEIVKYGNSKLNKSF